VVTEGNFRDLGNVYYSEEASANILSLAVLADSGADISYDHTEQIFTLTPAGSSNVYRFSRQKVPGSEGRFFVCDMREMASALVATVAENIARYTKREVAAAGKARELLARMGYPSVESAISMLKGGSNFDVCEYDFRVAHAIWGKDLATIRGKSKKVSTRAADITLTSSLVQQEQALSVDIMFVETVASLVAVATPLDLTFAMSLFSIDLLRPSRAASMVKKGLDDIIALLSSRNFKVKLIMSDGEGAIGKLRPYLNSIGVEVDVSGAGGHVARIERRIQMVKERMRSHMCGRIPFTLNILGIAMLVLYCVSRINFQHSGSRPGGLTPREAFSGQRVDGARDFRAAFGDYAVCTVPSTDNSMSSRTEDCIVMLPTGNRTGSVKMLNITTGKLVTRDSFVIMPMPQSVISRLNQLATADGRKLKDNTTHVFNELLYGHSISTSNMPKFILPPPTQNDVISSENLTQGEVGGEAQELAFEHGSDEHTAEGMPQPGHQESVMEEVPPPNREVLQDALQLTAPQDPPDQPEEQTTPVRMPGDGPSMIPPPQRNLLEYFRTGETALAVIDQPSIRLTTSAVQSVRDTLQRQKGELGTTDTSNISVREALRTRGDEARIVIVKELRQMLDKRVWVPVIGAKLSAIENSRVIRSSMFIKRKNFPDGKFEKLKARLVAGGDQQDKKLYDDLSSPTVSTSAVFTMIAVSAFESRHTAVVDISGAYLNADMPVGVPVHMRLDSLITLDKRYEKYADPNGRVIVLLRKALYGCVESAALWYNNLKVTMIGLGYQTNVRDGCVFNKVGEKGVQCTATVHVDDLLIMSTSKKMISDLAEGLRVRYGEITLAHGPFINYLGMALDFSRAGEARVTMSGYVEEILRVSGVVGTAKTPATDGLFEVRKDAVLVPEDIRAWFHKVVAMILYIAKRARPECLTAVAYLSTRVTRCDVDDVVKLQRLVRYMRGTKDTGLVLRPGKLGLTVRLYVDASYGVHVDGKSHTGSCVVIGDVGAVHCRSSKQLIVTKSSTEAELVGLSDSANQGIYIRDFLLEQGLKTGPMTIYQDNMSCMALVDRGRSGAERTRHIAIRYFWVKELVDKNEAVIRHMGTEEMYANVLTKPLQGSQFVYERECLTGWAV
jgi:Reverse transcriptase (RNA-dependent DNA polymerase)